MSLASQVGEAVELPRAATGRPVATAALLLAGGAAATVAALLQVDGAVVVILMGASLCLAGARNPQERWAAGVGLPILGFLGGVELSQLVAPLAGYKTTAAFVGMGGALLAAARLATPPWAVIAGIFFIDAGLAAATVSLGAWRPWQASAWLFGVAEMAVGAWLLIRLGEAPGAPSRKRTPTRTLQPARLVSPAIQALAVFAGGVAVAVVDRLTGNLYQVVLALGVAYLGAGVLTHHRGWRQSGALIAALGAAITLTDFVPETVNVIYVLVFSAIVVASVALQLSGGGSVAGLGRSLIVIGLVLAALAALPQVGAIDLFRDHLDVLLPLAPLASAVAILVRRAMRSESERT